MALEMFLPGSTKTRALQLVTFGYVALQQKQNGVPEPWNYAVALSWSTIVGWAAFVGMSAREARNTLEYLTNGEALVDAVNHARGA